MMGRDSLDEDEAGASTRITLTRLHMATNELPLAMTSTHIYCVPGGLALVDPVTSAAPTWTH